MKQSKDGFFYGWIVLAAAFLSVMMSAALTIYGFSIFVVPVTSALNIPVSAFVLGITFTTIMGAICSPLVGTLCEKVGARLTSMIGGLILFSAFLILSFAKALPFFYIGYMLCGIGSGFTGPVVGTTLATKWFSKYRGLASGIVSAGTGIGGMIMTPILARILTNQGYSRAYLIMAFLALVFCTVIGGLLIRNKPEDMGLFPDGAQASVTSGSAAPAVFGLTQKEALRTAAYWAIGIGILIFSYAQMGILQTQNPALQSLGFDPMLATAVVSITGIISSASKIAFGFMVDRIPLKVNIMIGWGLLAAGGFLLSSFTGATATSMVYVYCIIFGIGLGCWQPILTICVTKAFGVKHVGAIFGSLFFLKAVGDTLGPITASAVYDMTGSYSPAYFIYGIITIVSLIIFMVYKNPSVEQQTGSSDVQTTEEV